MVLLEKFVSSSNNRFLSLLCLSQVLALREAMNNQEEPSVLQQINDEENAELLFIIDAFNYAVSYFLKFAFLCFESFSFIGYAKAFG